MNILLVSPLIQECNYFGDFYAGWPQLGITYIASTLENSGHKVKILEKKLLSGPDYPKSEDKIVSLDNKFLQELENFKPDIVGLTATTPVIMDAFHTARFIKKFNPNILIIAGGRHPTSEYISTLNSCLEIDAVCCGEGEYTMLDFAKGLSFEKIAGIAYRNGNGKAVKSPERPLCKDIDQIPPPAWHLLDEEFYFKPNISIMRGDYMRSATIFTARGCPYNCAFCQSPEMIKTYGPGYIRYHSLDRVMLEIQHLVDRYKVEGISISDDLFALKKSRVLDFCNRIIKKGLNKKIKFTVNMRSDSVDEEMLLTLKEAGCIHVVYGTESGSDDTLKRMNKKTDSEKNLKAIQLAKKVGLVSESNIVIGSPGETEKDMMKTIKFLKESKPDKIFVSKFYPIPGTQFYKNLVEKGIIKISQNWDELNTMYVETDDFTFADMTAKKFIKLRNKANREIVLWTNYMYVVRKNFNKDIKLAITQFIKMGIYISFYYLPLSVQMRIKKIAEMISFNLRYSFRK